MYIVPKVYKAYPLGDGGPGSQSYRLLNALKSPAWSHTSEKGGVWVVGRNAGLLILLYSVPSYSQQSCGNILWLCSNTSPAQQGQKLRVHANPSCPYCKNPLSSVPHFELCSSSVPATYGADLTAWSNYVLVQPGLSQLQPCNDASVLYTPTPPLHLRFM